MSRETFKKTFVKNSLSPSTTLILIFALGISNTSQQSRDGINPTASPSICSGIGLIPPLLTTVSIRLQNLIGAH
jgi:hypothetical protein